MGHPAPGNLPTNLIWLLVFALRHYYRSWAIDRSRSSMTGEINENLRKLVRNFEPESGMCSEGLDSLRTSIRQTLCVF
jgi:hypothetical protein